MAVLVMGIKGDEVKVLFQRFYGNEFCPIPILERDRSLPTASKDEARFASGDKIVSPRLGATDRGSSCEHGGNSIYVRHEARDIVTSCFQLHISRAFLGYFLLKYNDHMEPHLGITIDDVLIECEGDLSEMEY